jgi:FAD:protein FMN transferase
VKRYVEHVMGLPISLALRGRHEDDATAEEAWAAVMDSLRDADAVFSTYRPESWVSRLGRGEVTLAECPAEVAEVLAIGERARRQSGGAFDVRRQGVFDPSGVVKGWAVERASAALRELPETDFCLSGGGDLVAYVADPDAPDWRIGVEDPHDPARVVAVVPVRDGAVATSGLTHRGAHVVDARTGRPPAALASVTVVGPSLTEADVAATAALALDADGPGWLRASGSVGVLVWADGRVEVLSPQACSPGVTSPFS